MPSDRIRRSRNDWMPSRIRSDRMDDGAEAPLPSGPIVAPLYPFLFAAMIIVLAVSLIMLSRVL